MASFPPCHPQQPALSICFPHPKWPLYRYICDGNTRHLLKNCSTVHEIVTAYLLEVESAQASWRGLHMWGAFLRTTAAPQGVRGPAALLPTHPAAPWCAGCWSKARRWSDRRAPETCSLRCSACRFGSISQCRSYCGLHSSADTQTILLGSFNKRATCSKTSLNKLTVLFVCMKLFSLVGVFWQFQTAINSLRMWNSTYPREF